MIIRKLLLSFLILIGTLITILLVFVGFLILNKKKPATNEKNLSVLNYEFETTKVLNNTDNYIKLIDVLDKYKIGILDSIKKNSSDCYKLITKITCS